MLLKELTLKEFRQFKGTQKIAFSPNKDKNVTIIVGENGTGKTTFAQAFTWCLYGETTFNDKKLLCKSTAQDMLPNDEMDVSVSLKFVHKKIDYICTRSLTYVKDATGNIKPKTNNSKFVIEYKDASGQQKNIADNMLVGEVNKILPKELSSYFFFDGERIGNMSKEITNGASKEFPKAVKSLLGLAPFEQALHHLNGAHNSNSVVRQYNKRFDSSSNSELDSIMKEIDQILRKKDANEARIARIDEVDLPSIRFELNRIEELQRKSKDAEILLEKKKGFEKDRGKTENLRDLNVKDLLKSFSDGCYNFFLKNMIVDVLQALSDADIKDKGIPDIHERTIRYLIEQKKCICGAHIENGSETHQHLIDLLKYIPPQSLGTSIRNFVGIANEKAKNDGFYGDFIETFSRIRANDDEITQQNDNISAIESQLAGFSEGEIARLQRDYTHYRDIELDLNKEKAACEQNNLDLAENLQGKEQSKSKYTNIGDTNKRIARYQAYAEYIYQALSKQYKDEERKVREQFEKTINQIFKEIYAGGLSLKIDEKYNIKILVQNFNEYNVDVETSTAQSLSVILAFISAVIQMARVNEESGNKLLVTESYPLVMDAPLSAFDTRRIQSICDVLPGIAEQVIIFINDKDGVIAENNMKSKIGMKYHFKKKNEFETYMEEQNV